MKLEEQVLTIEQAKHLQKLGLDMSDAAFAWFTNRHTQESHLDRYIDRKHSVYTYTLQEILGKLPKYVGSIKLNVSTDSICYRHLSSGAQVKGYRFTTMKGFFDAAYLLLCWLLENKFLDEE